MSISSLHSTRGYARLHRLQHLPSCLVAVRVSLGPLLYLMTVRGVAGAWLVLGLSAAFLSDVFEGILARRIGVATERLRVADSWADGWFYVWVAAAVGRTAPEVVRASYGCRCWSWSRCNCSLTLSIWSSIGGSPRSMPTPPKPGGLRSFWQRRLCSVSTQAAYFCGWRSSWASSATSTVLL